MLRRPTLACTRRPSTARVAVRAFVENSLRDDPERERRREGASARTDPFRRGHGGGLNSVLAPLPYVLTPRADAVWRAGLFFRLFGLLPQPFMGSPPHPRRPRGKDFIQRRCPKRSAQILAKGTDNPRVWQCSTRTRKECDRPPEPRPPMHVWSSRDCTFAARYNCVMGAWQDTCFRPIRSVHLGIVAKPIRVWLAGQRNRRSAWRALHRCIAQLSVDVNWMLDLIATYEEPDVLTSRELWDGLMHVCVRCSLIVCEQYRDRQRTASYALAGAHDFDILCANMRNSLTVIHTLAHDDSSPDALSQTVMYINRMRNHLDDAVRLRRVSPGLIRRYEKKLKPTAVEDAIGIIPIVRHKASAA